MTSVLQAVLEFNTLVATVPYTFPVVSELPRHWVSTHSTERSYEMTCRTISHPLVTDELLLEPVIAVGDESTQTTCTPRQLTWPTGTCS